MTTRQLLTTAWDWEPSVVVGCAFLLIVYFMWARPRILGKSVLYTTGVIVLLLALVSPIDTLSDNYLFSVHMIQHLLLILVVAPLMLLGLPRQTAERIVGNPRLAGVERTFSHPLIAWTILAAALGLWHVPMFYNYALAHEGVHIFQHLSFLVAAVIFWWPILTPISELRLTTGPAVLYLFLATIFNSLLGIIITFVPLGWYPAYIHPKDEFGALSLIRNQWGISAAADQQLGGLLMWVPAGLIYFTIIVLLVVRWQSQDGLEEPEHPQIAGGQNAA